MKEKKDMTDDLLGSWLRCGEIKTNIMLHPCTETFNVIQQKYLKKGTEQKE